MRLPTRSPDVIYLRRRPVHASSVIGPPGEGGGSNPSWLPKPELPAPPPAPKPESEPLPPPRPMPRPVAQKLVRYKPSARARKNLV